MPHYTNTVLINKPIKLVYDYVTTPDYWPIYHFVSKKVEPSLKHPFQMGDPEIVETVDIGGVTQNIHWNIALNESPNLFIINGISHEYGGGTAQLIYTLADINGATWFQRDFKYAETNFFVKTFDELVLSKIVAKDGKESLQKVKAILESMPT